MSMVGSTSGSRLGKAYIALPLMAILLISSILIQRMFVSYGGSAGGRDLPRIPGIGLNTSRCGDVVYVLLYNIPNDTVVVERIRIGNITYSKSYTISNDTVLSIRDPYGSPYIILRFRYRGYSFLKYSRINSRCYIFNNSVTYIGVENGLSKG